MVRYWTAYNSFCCPRKQFLFRIQKSLKVTSHLSTCLLRLTWNLYKTFCHEEGSNKSCFCEKVMNNSWKYFQDEKNSVSRTSLFLYDLLLWRVSRKPVLRILTQIRQLLDMSSKLSSILLQLWMWLIIFSRELLEMTVQIDKDSKWKVGSRKLGMSSVTHERNWNRWYIHLILLTGMRWLLHFIAISYDTHYQMSVRCQSISADLVETNQNKAIPISIFSHFKKSWNSENSEISNLTVRIWSADRGTSMYTIKFERISGSRVTPMNCHETGDIYLLPKKVHLQPISSTMPWFTHILSWRVIEKMIYLSAASLSKRSDECNMTWRCL